MKYQCNKNYVITDIPAAVINSYIDRTRYNFLREGDFCFQELLSSLKNFSSFNNPEYYCNNCDYKQDMNEPACMHSYKSYQPSNDEDDSYNIQQISHDIIFIISKKDFYFFYNHPVCKIVSN